MWEPYEVKTQTIKTAVESAMLLLRIDDIVSGIQKKDKMAPGQSKPAGPQAEDADQARWRAELIGKNGILHCRCTALQYRTAHRHAISLYIVNRTLSPCRLSAGMSLAGFQGESAASEKAHGLTAPGGLGGNAAGLRCLRRNFGADGIWRVQLLGSAELSMCRAAVAQRPFSKRSLLLGAGARCSVLVGGRLLLTNAGPGPCQCFPLALSPTHTPVTSQSCAADLRLGQMQVAQLCAVPSYRISESRLQCLQSHAFLHTIGFFPHQTCICRAGHAPSLTVHYVPYVMSIMIKLCINRLAVCLLNSSLHDAAVSFGRHARYHACSTAHPTAHSTIPGTATQHT